MKKLSKTRKELGQFLKARREALGLSQNDIAKTFGDRSAQFVSNVERGFAGIPVNRIKACAELLGLSTKALADHVESVWRAGLDKKIRNSK